MSPRSFKDPHVSNVLPARRMLQNKVTADAEVTQRKVQEFHGKLNTLDTLIYTDCIIDISVIYEPTTVPAYIGDIIKQFKVSV